MASKLLGIEVHNNQNENLGSIQDIVFENGRSITGVVVRVEVFSASVRATSYSILKRSC